MSRLLRPTVIAVLTALVVGAFVLSAIAAPAVRTITISINNSPWLPGFREMAQLYEKQTGIQVELRVFPFSAMVEKELSAVQAPQSEFDIITLNEVGSSVFYSGGFVTPFQEIDPSFALDPEILQFNSLIRWDEEVGYSTPDGAIYSLPINGNIQLFYYRGDLYREAGLAPPVTWDDVIAAATKLHDPRRGFFGYANRGQRSSGSVSFDFYAFLRGFGGDYFAQPPYDWTVTIHSPQARQALELYVRLAKEFSPPNVANLGQAEQVALMTSGRLLQTILVAGAFADMDNPEKSLVVDKVEFAVVPKPATGRHATTSGALVMAIPRNLPKERQKAALDFLKWATSHEAQMFYAQAGAMPIRQDVLESELAGERRFRYMEAVAKSRPYVVNRPRIPVAPQFEQVLERRLNEAVSGQLSVDEALSLMQSEIEKVMKEAGYLK